MMDFNQAQQSLTGDASLSEYWRRNISSVESAELANLLRALRKVAGLLGANAGRVEYAGMSGGDGAAIIIDPATVMGRYPVPPGKVDEVAGLVIHEALHRIEWSDRVWELMEPDFSRTSGLSLVGLQKLIHTAEDIYVDSVVEHSILGLYTDRTRRNLCAAMQSPSWHGEVSLDMLLFLWWSSSWGESHIRETADSYREPCALLKDLSEKIRKISRASQSVTARCALRAELYRTAWNDIHPLVASWKIVDKKLHWYESTAQVESSGTRNKPQPAALAPLSPLLVREIETRLAATSSDITPLILSVVGQEHAEVVPTSRWDFNIPAHPVVDRRLVGRLKAVFQNYAARRTMVSRGLAGGKIDRRRLYRASVTGRCFKAVESLPSPDWNVTFLMDASGSMRGKKWRIVENTVANIAKALLGNTHHLQAYAYFEMDGVCMISRLIKERRLLSVPPNGQTASGQALIAAALFMPRHPGRKLLIHVTDGESNLGCDVRYGIDYCGKLNIHLVTLGCGCKDRSAMINQYGKTIQFVDHFGQLPQAVERLLKWTFLYGQRKPVREGSALH
ncbi:MAG: VWA domain-containing protein [Deltaproteobacteria bacterium]|nr:VWA domain-containing protein [Deltaproteobacteria bacterium]